MGAEIPKSLRGRYLTFRLAEQSYAVPVASVEEITAMAELAEVAGGPAFLAGFLDIAGQFIDVISLRRLFGLCDQPRELFTPLVILKPRIGQIAIEVDEVCEIAHIADTDSVALSGGYMVNDLAVAAARFQGSTVLLLSPDRLLLEQEHRRLQSLAEKVSDRLAAVDAGGQP